MPHHHGVLNMPNPVTSMMEDIRRKYEIGHVTLPVSPKLVLAANVPEEYRQAYGPPAMRKVDHPSEARDPTLTPATAASASVSTPVGNKDSSVSASVPPAVVGGSQRGNSTVRALESENQKAKTAAAEMDKAMEHLRGDRDPSLQSEVG